MVFLLYATPWSHYGLFGCLASPSGDACIYPIILLSFSKRTHLYLRVSAHIDSVRFTLVLVSSPCKVKALHLVYWLLLVLSPTSCIAEWISTAAVLALPHIDLWNWWPSDHNMWFTITRYKKFNKSCIYQSFFSLCIFSSIRCKGASGSKFQTSTQLVSPATGPKKIIGPLQNLTSKQYLPSIYSIKESGSSVLTIETQYIVPTFIWQWQSSIKTYYFNILNKEYVLDILYIIF